MSTHSLFPPRFLGIDLEEGSEILTSLCIVIYVPRNGNC